MPYVGPRRHPLTPTPHGLWSNPDGLFVVAGPCIPDNAKCNEVGANNTLGPYRSQETQLSVVVYLDILGYTETITESYRQKSDSVLLSRLHAALGDAKSHLTERHILTHGEKQWEVKLFTDNLVIGMPIFDDGELDLGVLFQLAGMYQYSLAQHGFFIRGAIAVGDLFMAGDMVFGEGLLQAHDAESQLARDPRIVLAPSALNLVEKHLCYYASVRSSPHEYELLVDTDRQVFVNYLMIPLDGDRGNSYHRAGLKKHKTHIEENLAKFRTLPRIWNKYAWAANYHNFVCEWLSPKSATLKINPDYLQPHPRRLHSVYAKLGNDLIERDSGKTLQSGSAVQAEYVKRYVGSRKARQPR